MSSIDTSKLTNINLLFEEAGTNAITWEVIIPRTNGAGINNTTTNIYGKTTSNYSNPPEGREFILASEQQEI